MEVNPLWDEEAEKIAADRGRVIVLGAIDTGKTTLVLYLVEKLIKKGLRVALIDGDLGQSLLGPPTTLGMTTLEKSSPLNLDNSVLHLRFVGATSPSGHLLSTIIGLKKLVDKAERLGAEVIIIDTTGLISGAVGCELKRRKIELIEPHRIIALQRNNELEPILSPLKFCHDFKVSRLPIAGAVRCKSMDYRREYRCRKFRDYFKSAEIIASPFLEFAIWGSWIGNGRELSKEELDFLSSILQNDSLYAEDCYSKIYVIVAGHYATGELYKARQYFKMRDVIITEIDFYRNILTSLENLEGESQGLALIVKLDFEQKKILLLTPVKKKDKIRRISFGYLRVNPSGDELERITYPS